MTTPTSDPLAALADELGRIGRRLDGMGVELLALRESAPGAATRPAGLPPVAAAGQSPTGVPAPSRRPAAPPQGGPVPAPSGTPVASDGRAAGPPAGLGPVPPVAGWGAPPQPGWARGGWLQPGPPGGPHPGWGGPQHAGPPPQADPRQMGPQPTGPKAAPKRFALTGARLLAWTGGAVTLLGVVLLLALAASRGWFTPPARIAFGAVLGAGLVGLGVGLHRRESARAGALALVATGFATLYLVDAAATAIYAFLPAVPALLLALLIAGAGLGLADRWRTELLAGGVVVGAVVLAPALADGWLLAALALALQLAALPVVLRRRWAVLMVLAAVGPVLYGFSAVANEDGGPPSVFVVVGVAAAVLVVAGATVLLALRVRLDGPAVGDGPDSSTPVPAGPDRVAGARMWIGSAAAVVAASALPALAAAAVLDGWRGALVAVGAAALLAVVAFLPETVRPVRIAGGTAATVALFTATVTGLSGSAVDIAVLGEALIAALLATGLRSRFAMITALALGAVGLISAVVQYAPLSTLLRFYTPSGVAELVTAVVVSVLLLALSAALLVAGGRLGWVRPDAQRAVIWVPFGLVGLYGAASVVVNAALLISPTPSGFTAGHAVVTVSWTVGALVLLARGLRRPALRIAGLVLVAAAVAKLVLFDLVALDGLARVGAFLGAGLVLLAAGTRYARLVAEADKPPSE
jgi:uncharacterized membrane protein